MTHLVPTVWVHYLSHCYSTHCRLLWHTTMSYTLMWHTATHCYSTPSQAIMAHYYDIHGTPLHTDMTHYYRLFWHTPEQVMTHSGTDDGTLGHFTRTTVLRETHWHTLCKTLCALTGATFFRNLIM